MKTVYRVSSSNVGTAINLLLSVQGSVNSAKVGAHKRHSIGVAGFTADQNDDGTHTLRIKLTKRQSVWLGCSDSGANEMRWFQKTQSVELNRILRKLCQMSV